MRGPSSVIYGSQNMGGVINIILKTGRTAPGNSSKARCGSWDLLEGKAQSGGVYKGFDWYVGGRRQHARQLPHRRRRRSELNTGLDPRYGVTGALGYQIDDNNRVDVNVRTDGIYDAGFRGSSANLFAFDTRYNHLVRHQLHRQDAATSGVNFFFQAYGVNDVDDLNNPSPLSALNAVDRAHHGRPQPARQLDILGTRFQPRFKFCPATSCCSASTGSAAGCARTATAHGGAAVTQLSPQDNNQTDNVFAVYLEDSQSLLRRPADRARRRAPDLRHDGARLDAVRADADPRHQSTTRRRPTRPARTYAVTDWLTCRAGASSGFRAPTATELGANFTTTPIGNTIFGNPGLEPETSQQFEVGATVDWNGGRFDAALFQNTHHQPHHERGSPSSTGGRRLRRPVNNPGEHRGAGHRVAGAGRHAQDVQLLPAGNWRWNVFGNGYYNFNMIDCGAPPAAGTDPRDAHQQVRGMASERVRPDGTADVARLEPPAPAASCAGRCGTTPRRAFRRCSSRAEPQRHRLPRRARSGSGTRATRSKSSKGINLFAAVNNIFDVNHHPIFIALDQTPCIANPRQSRTAPAATPCRDASSSSASRTVVMQASAVARSWRRRALWAGRTAAGDPVTVRDAFDRAVTLPAPPQRIVTIFASNTEMVAALGLADRIVGIEAYTRYPPEVLSKPLVGGRLGFSVDAVVAQRPDLVVVTPARQAANQLVDPMERLGVPIVVLLQRNVPEIFANIRLLGRLAGVPERGEAVGWPAASPSRPASSSASPDRKRRAPIMITGRLGNGLLLMARPGTYTGDAIELRRRPLRACRAAAPSPRSRPRRSSMPIPTCCSLPATRRTSRN